MSFQPSSRSLALPQVLIVDDDAAVLDVARSMARAVGWHALVCDHPGQAVELFREHADRIRAVLVDLHMPGADGVALARTFRELAPDTRVLVMTGDTLEEDRITASGVEPGCILIKPFSISGLQQALAGGDTAARAA